MKRIFIGLSLALFASASIAANGYTFDAGTTTHDLVVQDVGSS